MSRYAPWAGPDVVWLQLDAHAWWNEAELPRELPGFVQLGFPGPWSPCLWLGDQHVVAVQSRAGGIVAAQPTPAWWRIGRRAARAAGLRLVRAVAGAVVLVPG